MATMRKQPRRDWRRVPDGTPLVGPAGVGSVQLRGGLLADGRTPNRALVQAGITRNAWAAYLLTDGRPVKDAYDAGEWHRTR